MPALQPRSDQIAVLRASVDGVGGSAGDHGVLTFGIDAIAVRFVAGAGASVHGAITRFDLYAPGLEQTSLSLADVLFAHLRD